MVKIEIPMLMPTADLGCLFLMDRAAVAAPAVLLQPSTCILAYVKSASYKVCV